MSFRAFAIIKPISTGVTGKILTLLHKNGLRVTRLKKAKLAKDDVNFIFSDMSSDPTYP